MYIRLTLLCIIILGAVLLKTKNGEWTGRLDANEHPLRFFYPLAAYIYGLAVKLGWGDLAGSRDMLREIYYDELPEESQRIQGCKCIASILAVIAATCFIGFAYEYSYEAALVDDRYLKRNPAGKGNIEYELMYESSLQDRQELKKVSVSEVRLVGEAFDELKKSAQDYLDKKIFINNESRNCVREPLNLVHEVPDTGITVKWSNDNSWFVSSTGELKNADYEEPVTATLHADLYYFDEEWEYTAELTVMPKVVTADEVFIDELERKMEENDIRTSSEELYELPEEVGEWSVKWSEVRDNSVNILMLLGIVAAIAVVPAVRQDLKKKQKKRNEEMMRDYPDIISKFTMLLTAGMTCRGAWEKICNDYLRMRQRALKTVTETEKGGLGLKKKKAVVNRYAYEEMLISLNELRLGTPETRVYERFGTRCNLLAYQRFGTMLSRNIRRGSAGIIDSLELEARESFAERRENVRIKGEETGTRLLIPMFGMLIIVLAIVVVPAFTSFNGGLT